MTESRYAESILSIYSSVTGADSAHPLMMPPTPKLSAVISPFFICFLDVAPGRSSLKKQVCAVGRGWSRLTILNLVCHTRVVGTRERPQVNRTSWVRWKSSISSTISQNQRISLSVALYLQSAHQRQ